MFTTPLMSTSTQRRLHRLLAIVIVASFALQSSMQFSPQAVAATTSSPEIPAEDESSDGVFQSAAGTESLAASAIEAPLIAADTGWLAPTSNSVLETTVTDPANAYAEDSVDAVFNASSAVKYGDFGISVPSGALMTGIEVKTRAHSSTSTERNFNVSVSWDNGTHWSASVDTTNADITYVTDVLGGPTNAWGHTWSTGQLTDGQFAARIRDDFGGTDVTAGLDVVAIKIHYTTIEPNPELPQACGLDLGLVIDSSGSIEPVELTQMKNAYKDFVDAFLPGTPTRMSVVEYDTNVVLPTLGFTTDITDIKNDVDASNSGGWTNWEAGLYASHNTYDPRPAKPDLMLFASDGNPNTTGITGNSDGGAAGEAAALTAAVTRANAIKADGIRILALGIGDNLDVPNLQAISGPNVNTGVTSDVITSSFDTLAADLAELANDLCGGKILVQKQFDTDDDGQADIDGTTPDPLLAGYTFDVDGEPSNPTAQVTTNTGSLEFSVLNGTYSAQEKNLPANTRLVSAECVLGQTPVGTVDLDARTVSGLTLTTDQTIACTFTNTSLLGSISGHKFELKNSGQTPVSGWTITLEKEGEGWENAGQTLTDASGSYTFINLWPGSYRVCEVIPVTVGYSWQQLSPTEPSCYTMAIASNGHETNKDFVNQKLLADLTVTKTDGLTTATTGQTVTYTIVVQNAGLWTADSVSVSDTLPPQATYVSSTLDGVNAPATVTANAAGDALAWASIGSIPPAGSKTIAVTVTLDALFPFGTTALVNTVQVLTTSVESNTNNNTATDTTAVSAKPTLSLAKTASPNPVIAGQTIRYTLNWSVAGNSVATLVTITDPIPANTQFVSVEDGGSFNAVSNTVNWNLGTQNPGAAGQVHFTVQSSTTVSNGATITNTAVIDAAEVDPPVQAVANVTVNVPPAPTVLAVTAEPALAITKNAHTAFVNRGGTVRYSIEVRNTGEATAINVTVNDVLPEHFTFAADNTTAKTFAIGTLEPGQAFQIAYDVKVGSQAKTGKQVNVAAATADNAPSVTDSAAVSVRTVKVLAATGAGTLDRLLALLALVTLAAGLMTIAGLRRRRLA